jgi:hypothetical protein
MLVKAVPHATHDIVLIPASIGPESKSGPESSSPGWPFPALFGNVEVAPVF